MNISNATIVDLCLNGISNDVSPEAVKEWSGMAIRQLNADDPEAPQFVRVVQLLAEVKEKGWEASASRVEAFKATLEPQQVLLHKAVSYVGLVALNQDAIAGDSKERLISLWLQEGVVSGSLDMNFINHLTPIHRFEFLQELFRQIARDFVTADFLKPANQPVMQQIFSLWLTYLPLGQQLSPHFSIHNLRPGQLDPYVQVLLSFSPQLWNQMPQPFIEAAQSWIHLYLFRLKEIEPALASKSIVRHVNYSMKPIEQISTLFQLLREMGNITLLGKHLRIWPPVMHIGNIFPFYPSLLVSAALDHLYDQKITYLEHERVFTTARLGLTEEPSQLIYDCIAMKFKETPFDVVKACKLLWRIGSIKDHLEAEDKTRKKAIGILVDFLTAKLYKQYGTERTWSPYLLVSSFLNSDRRPVFELLRAINDGYPDLDELQFLTNKQKQTLAFDFSTLSLQQQISLRRLGSFISGIAGPDQGQPPAPGPLPVS